MRRALMLMKQLHEAQKFILKDDVNSKRLALILLDNFIEVQLFAQVEQCFWWGNRLRYSYRRCGEEYEKFRYSKKMQEKALKYHDALLDVAASEGYIEKEDLHLIKFAHKKRNASYHSFEEEETLTKVGIYLLYVMICKYQKRWGNAGDMLIYSSEDVLDEELAFFGVKYGNFSFCWEHYWDGFYYKFFRVDSLERLNVPQILSNYVMNILCETEKSIKFIKKHTREEYDFNKLLYEYNFHKKREALIIESELPPEELTKIIQDVSNEYQKSFRKKSTEYIKGLYRRAKNLSNSSTLVAIQKYDLLIKDADYIHSTFCGIASDIENEIQSQIDIVRGK